ncbi:hypothetical protein [Pseudonocardia adelaidensis]|uniref:Transposase n=1 Tax=Pseudonocardia adelaidensis TaxID=648754 RepID=A0ABP9NNT7_9PSEU
MTATITMTATPPRTAPAEGLPSMLAYLTRVLKTPTIGRCWEELAEQARNENWSHEEYLAAVLASGRTRPRRRPRADRAGPRRGRA